MSDPKDEKDELIDTLRHHVKELREDNECLRDEIFRLRSIIRQDGLGIGIAHGIDFVRELLKI